MSPHTFEAIAQAHPFTVEGPLKTPSSATDLDPRVLQAALGPCPVDQRLMLLVFGAALTAGLSEMTVALRNQDWLEAGEVAHQLSANAKTVGALRLAEAMEHVEHAARSHQIEALLALHADLPHLVSAFEASQSMLLH